MKIIQNLEDYSPSASPISLSIGNFDGLHKGHQTLLMKLKEHGKETIIFTFENHPSEILRPFSRTLQICYLAHKLKLLEEWGVDVVILKKFTKEFSLKTADTFIQELWEYIPFSHLILGHDATLGRNKEGDRSYLQAFANQHHFQLHFLSPYTYKENLISSTKIREYIQKGDLNQVKALLGRPYSIYGMVIKGMSQGSHLGFPTANICVSGLCLPPLGVYAVTVIYHEKCLSEDLCPKETLSKVIKKRIIKKGIANLGIAPTMRHDNKPLLEVHLFMNPKNLYDHYVEVIFEQFIRPEIFFNSSEELKTQIQRDILNVQTLLEQENS